MKKMVYEISRKKAEILYSGKYKGYKFAICNLGTHPTAAGLGGEYKSKKQGV